MKKRIIAITTASLLAFVLVLGFMAMPPEAMANTTVTPDPTRPELTPAQAAQALSIANISVGTQTINTQEVSFTLQQTNIDHAQRVQGMIYGGTNENWLPQGSILRHIFQITPSVSGLTNATVRIDIPGIAPNPGFRALVSSDGDNWGFAGLSVGNGFVNVTFPHFSYLIIVGPGPTTAAADYTPLSPQTGQ